MWSTWILFLHFFQAFILDSFYMVVYVCFALTPNTRTTDCSILSLVFSLFVVFLLWNISVSGVKFRFCSIFERGESVEGFRLWSSLRLCLRVFVVHWTVRYESDSFYYTYFLFIPISSVFVVHLFYLNKSERIISYKRVRITCKYF